MNAPLWVNIAPLLPDREAEVEADLRRLARETCVDSVAFSCSLHPEGDPPLDKAAAFAPSVIVPATVVCLPVRPHLLAR